MNENDNENEQNNNQPLPLDKPLTLGSFHDFIKEMKEEDHTRFTGQFNPQYPKEAAPEGSLSNNSSSDEPQIKILDILKNLVIYKFPLIFLIVYIILVVNYVTLIYFMIGLFIINLELENYYIKITKQSPLNTPLKNIAILYRKIDFTSYLYIVLIVSALIIFIFKIIYCFLMMFNPLSISDIDPRFLQNFDIYFDSSFKTKEILLTLLPNFFMILVPLILVLMKKKEPKKMEAWDLNLNKEFNILIIVNGLIIVCFIILPAFDFNFFGMIFYLALLIAVLLNSMKRFYEKIMRVLYWFYQIIKFFLIFVFFLNYFGSIELNNNNLPLEERGFFNFQFLGIDSFYQIISVDVIFLIILNKL